MPRRKIQDEEEELIQQPVNLEEARSVIDDLIASKTAIQIIEDAVVNEQGANLLTLEKPIRKVRVDPNEKEELLKVLNILREKTEKRLKSLNDKMDV